MKTYKIGSEKYKYICTAHEDIHREVAEILDMARDIQKRADKIVELYKIALEMGRNMEEAIIDRNDKIESQKDLIGELRAKIAELKEKKKRGKNDMG